MVSKREPTQEELQRRRIVGVHAEHVSNISSTDFPGHFPGEDHRWSLEKFRKNFRVEFHQNEQFESQFSLVGIDAAIANAFRRILIAELPTLAIEDVYILKNTSIIQDEVLAHRLGLIPLKGSPEAIRNMTWYKKPEAGEAEQGSHTDYNTVVLELNVQCEWRPEGRDLAKKGETDPNKLFINSSVYAHQIKFIPTGRQADLFAGENAIQPVNPDILIAKLRPGQAINLSMHCIKGIGADHAKFSPVATATYRLLPHIEITQPIVGPLADKFARCFPPGVIAQVPVTADEAADRDGPYAGCAAGDTKAVVANPFNDTVTREVLRHDELRDKVRLGRVRDHFIFSVESTGQFDSDDLFIQSVKALKAKCQIMKRNMASLMR